MSPSDRFQVCGTVSGLLETVSTKAEAFRLGAEQSRTESETIEVFDCFAHPGRPECWRYDRDSDHWIEQSKRIGMLVKTAPVSPMFTVEEVFAWVCQKQSIQNPDHLTNARWRSLHYAAEQATKRLNALFASTQQTVPAPMADLQPDEEWRADFQWKEA